MERQMEIIQTRKSINYNMNEFDNSYFDEIIQRRGSGSYKWDSAERSDTLPLWVADMDFRTAPPIIEALHQRVNHGIFGYTYVGNEYYNAVTQWFAKNHHWHINPEWIIYTSGVVPAVSAIIKALCQPGDKVITQTPAYNCFFSSIRNNNCQLANNDLIHSNGLYSIDYDNLELLASDPKSKLLILCNPHNPSGRVWTADELRRVGEICLRNNVVILSDEIHCELAFNGHKYIPFGSLGNEFANNSVSCISPSKSFNIAGLQIANIVCADSAMRKLIDRAININEVCDVNPFGIVATIAAYNHGTPWLNTLKHYIWENYQLLVKLIDDNLPQLSITPLEGTYLAWMNIKPTGLSSEEFTKQLFDKESISINPGTMYGQAGEGFVRINLACPRTILSEAINRIIHFSKNFT